MTAQIVSGLDGRSCHQAFFHHLLQSGLSCSSAVSDSSVGNSFAELPDDDPQRKQPVIPHAAPILDADGRLTYVGSDGLRYVVAEPPEETSES